MFLYRIVHYKPFVVWLQTSGCSVLNKLTLYLKQKKVKKHGKVQ